MYYSKPVITTDGYSNPSYTVSASFTTAHSATRRKTINSFSFSCSMSGECHSNWCLFLRRKAAKYSIGFGGLNTHNVIHYATKVYGD